MGYDYDKLYGETRDALGAPTAIFTDFFDRLDAQYLRVLDVGCGQGRDAISIARQGHRVVGVDISPNGIHDLQEAAAQGWVLIADEASNMADFKRVISEHAALWTTELSRGGNLFLRRA